MPEEEKIKGAQKVYDAVMNAFPGLRDFMINSQARCHKLGYTETILGRRRHLPDMTLDEFEFQAMPGYVNPDIDPLDPTTLENKSQIPERIVSALKEEFKGYKYFGQIVKRTKELAEKKIKVINNRAKINDATREVVNCVDFETEILTLNGWKKYNEVSPGDLIYTYDAKENQIVKSHIEHVHVHRGEQRTIEFNSRRVSAVSTPDHRWPVLGKGIGSLKFVNSEYLYSMKSVHSKLITSGSNSFRPNHDWSLNQLYFLGFWMSNEFNSWSNLTTKVDCRGSKYASSLLRILSDKADREHVKYLHELNNGEHCLTLLPCHFKKILMSTFIERKIPHSFISSLSELQAVYLLNGMLHNDVWNESTHIENTFSSGNEELLDIFQHACLVAGLSTYRTGSADTGYTIHTSPKRIATLSPNHKSTTTSEGVWCVTTPESTWIARRNGTVYVTGNSIIQGSAADLTKMAILELVNDPRWQRLGAKLILPIHDELCCEVPLEYRKEAEEILSDCMCRAATFMPFEISCDVETTFRWYGLSVDDIMSFDRPETLDPTLMSESNIKWVQCRLCEMEYLCPVIKEPDGSKPRGIAAKGVNGVWNSVLDTFIDDYCSKHRITRDNFIEDIDRRVLYAY